MTPQEAEIIHDVFERVRAMGPAPRDPAAEAEIRRAVEADPDALVGLVRAVVALDRERNRLVDENQALRDALDGQPAEASRGGGLFDDLGHRRDDPRAPGPGYGRGPDRDDDGPRGRWGDAPWGRPRAPEPDDRGGPWGGRPAPGPEAPEAAGPAGRGGGILSTALGGAAGLAGGYFAYEALKGLFGGGSGASAHETASKAADGGDTFGSSDALVRSQDVASHDAFKTGGSLDDPDGFFGGDSDSTFS
jgi:hypothetical protein